MQLDDFLVLMDKLLGEDGCPWDKEQTHESLRPYLLEECYETIDAIDKRDMHSLKEELGDVLLQVVFHAKLAEKAGIFSMADITRGVADKLISRHTHVFGSDIATSADDVVKVWEANKQKERAHSPLEAMRDVPKALPGLVRAAKVLKRSGEDKPSIIQLCDDIASAVKGLANAKSEQNDLFGNILLKMVNLSAILEINPEFSLTNAVEGFINTKCKNSRI